MPDNPAPSGSFVTVYLTGQGAVDNLAFTGAAAPSLVPSHTLAPTSATVGPRPATVLFSGLAPRQVGVGQVKLRIPDLAPGDYPVIVTIGGVRSNAGMLSVGGMPVVSRKH